MKGAVEGFNVRKTAGLTFYQLMTAYVLPAAAQPSLACGFAVLTKFNGAGF